MARIRLPDGDQPEVVRALSLRPALAGAVASFDRAVWESQLDWRLHELVRMRIAQINQCAVCLSWRSPQAAGLDEELLASVDGYRTAVGFTPAERVALEYTERFATDSAAIDDGLLTRLSEHFAEGEVVELTLVVAKYLALGKFMQVLGLDQACGLEPDGAGSVSRY